MEQQQSFAAAHPMNVQAQINREKSIVVKTLPDSVMDQFSDMNSERMSRLNVNDDSANNNASFNPFAQEAVAQPAATINRVQIPEGLSHLNPPISQTAPAMDPFSPPEPAAASFTPQPELTPVATASAAPAATPAAPMPTPVDPVQDEARRLVGVIRGCLKKDMEGGNKNPMTIGVLSAQIKKITAKSWGGHWQSTHGPLTSFIKKYPDQFSLIRNKYLVLAGKESEMNIPQDDADKPVSKPASTYKAPDTKPMSSTPSQPTYNNILPQQPQVMYTQQPQYNSSYQQPNPFGNGMNPMMQPQQPQPMYQQQQPFYQQQQPVMQQQPMMQQPQPSFPSYPNQSVQSGGFAPQAQHMMPNSFNQTPQSQAQQPAPTFQATAPAATSQASFDPFLTPAAAPVASAPADDWWQTDTNATATTTTAPANAVDWDNPLDAFDSASDGASANDEVAEQMRKAEELRKKQEEEDAKFAKSLQDEEFARTLVSRGSAPAQSTYVTVSNTEILEMAKREIGAANVKIVSRFSVKKYGREGRPHQRKLWISAGLTHLVWESAQFEGSSRGICLQKVKEILIGHMTKTIQRSTKDVRKVSNLCFSLVLADRTFDLQACSVIQRDSLVAALQKVIEFNRKHKPVRVDSQSTKILVDAV